MNFKSPSKKNSQKLPTFHKSIEHNEKRSLIGKHIEERKIFSSKKQHPFVQKKKQKTSIAIKN
jgi:hypothetical protein